MTDAELLKVLGDESRLSLLYLLSQKAQCVCELEVALDISQSSTSKHLQRLKKANLIKSEKRGLWVYYSIVPTTFKQYPYLEALMQHLATEGHYEHLKPVMICEQSE